MLEVTGIALNEADFGDYRYGFNGKENDQEWGKLIQDYGFRLYNPAIAKFLSVDPLAPEYPELTPYQFASNRPIDGIDLDGLEYFRSSVNFSAGLKLTLNVGHKTAPFIHIDLNIGATGNLRLNSEAGFGGVGGVNLKMSYHTGGLGHYRGASTEKNGLGEVVLSSSLSLGGWQGVRRQVQTFSGRTTTSTMSDLKYAVTYAQSFAIMYEGANSQRLGSYGLTVNRVSLNMYEDHEAWFGDKHDRFWTGGGSLEYIAGNGHRFLFGLDSFTGEPFANTTNREKGYEYKIGNKWYVQKYEALSDDYNLGEMYFLYDNRKYEFGASYMGKVGLGLQNFIHGKIDVSDPDKGWEGTFHRFYSNIPNQVRISVAKSSNPEIK